MSALTAIMGKIDPSISLGNVLAVITILLGLWGASARIESRLSSIETKIEPMWAEFLTGGKVR